MNKVWVAADVGRQIINTSMAHQHVPGRHRRRHERDDGVRKSRLDKGRVQQTNFDKYPLIRLARAPAGDRRSVPEERQQPDRLGRTVHAADSAGCRQRDLLGHRRPRSGAADEEQRL